MGVAARLRQADSLLDRTARLVTPGDVAVADQIATGRLSARIGPHCARSTVAVVAGAGGLALAVLGPDSAAGSERWGGPATSAIYDEIYGLTSHRLPNLVPSDDGGALWFVRQIQHGSRLLLQIVAGRALPVTQIDSADDLALIRVDGDHPVVLAYNDGDSFVDVVDVVDRQIPEIELDQGRQNFSRPDGASAVLVAKAALSDYSASGTVAVSPRGTLLVLQGDLLAELGMDGVMRLLAGPRDGLGAGSELTVVGHQTVISGDTTSWWSFHEPAQRAGPWLAMAGIVFAAGLSTIRGRAIDRPRPA